VFNCSDILQKNLGPEVRFLETLDLPGSDFASIFSPKTTIGSSYKNSGVIGENYVLVTSTTKILKVRVNKFTDQEQIQMLFTPQEQETKIECLFWSKD
jgi:hypothetical protein